MKTRNQKTFQSRNAQGWDTFQTISVAFQLLVFVNTCTKRAPTYMLNPTSPPTGLPLETKTCVLHPLKILKLPFNNSLKHSNISLLSFPSLEEESLSQ